MKCWYIQHEKILSFTAGFMILAGGATVQGVPAYAQELILEEQELILEEVVVTARKREEKLMDIPESITAISGVLVDRQNIKGLNKIGMAVPNMNLSKRGDGYPNVSIRGVGAFGLTQGVGFYLDDVQLFGDASSRFGDLARIEVLKGPQGVLYGGSNIGGAVRYVSEQPSTEALSGHVKVLAGEQRIRDFESTVNIPLNDSWALRVFGFTREDDGFMTNPNSPSPVFGVVSNQPPKVGAYEESGGRLVLHGDVTDTFSVNVSARYNEYDGPANNWARELGQPPDMDYPFTLDTNQNPRLERETFGARAELTWSFESFDFKSITSYTDTDSFRLTDVDLTQLWFFNTHRPETIKVKTQEFRFISNGTGPLQWVAGFYATDFEETMNSTLDFGWIILDADDPSVHVMVPFETRQEDKGNLAVFGNVAYQTGDWELGFGLRVDRWKSEEEAVDIGHSASREETEVLPRLSVTRQMGNDAISYFTVSKGFEPGGWNGIADGSPPIFGPDGEKTLLGFDPEEALQYELGWKGSFAGGRGSATVALFYTEYESRQYEFIIPNPSGDGTLIDGITNVGDSTQWGIEISTAYQVNQYLLLTAAYGHIDAEWDDGTVLSDGSADLSGETPPNIIDHSASVTASFSMPLVASFDFVTDLQLSYNGEMQGGKPWDNVTNPDYTVVNLQVGLVSEQWELMLNVENLTDEEYYTDLEPFPNFGIDGLTGTGPANIIIGTHGHPRLVTASVTYRWF